MLDLFVDDKYVCIDLFPSHRIKIAILFKMPCDFRLLVSEATCQQYGFIHELIRYPAE